LIRAEVVFVFPTHSLTETQACGYQHVGVERLACIRNILYSSFLRFCFVFSFFFVKLFSINTYPAMLLPLVLRKKKYIVARKGKRNAVSMHGSLAACV
jgi:hypothetical protein